MRDAVTSALDVVGAGLVVAGAAMVSVPLALALAGAAVLAVSWRWSR